MEFINNLILNKHILIIYIFNTNLLYFIMSKNCIHYM